MFRTLPPSLSRNYRSPGLPYRIHHPHVVDKSWDSCSANREPVLNGLGKFIPRNFRMQQFVESVRTGEYLGSDYPYNLLPNSYWQKRKYNVEYKSVPDNISLRPRVDFYSRLNVWAVAWQENGKEYHRWFRVQVQGFQQAKLKAEGFQKMLEASGRLGESTKRRMTREEYMAERERRSKRYARTRLIRRGLF